METLLLSCEAAGTFSNEAFTRSSSGSGLGSVAVPDRADADAVVDLGVHGVRQTHLERLAVVYSSPARAERSTVRNQQVSGSSPLAGSNRINNLQEFRGVSTCGCVGTMWANRPLKPARASTARQHRERPRPTPPLRRPRRAVPFFRPRQAVTRLLIGRAPDGRTHPPSSSSVLVPVGTDAQAASLACAVNATNAHRGSATRPAAPPRRRGAGGYDGGEIRGPQAGGLAATTGSGGWPFPALPALARCVPGRTGSLATHGSSARRLPLRQWPVPDPLVELSDEGRILERPPANEACQATSGIDPPATPKTDPPKKRRMLLKWGTQRRCISVATDHRSRSRDLVYESKDDDACGFCGRRLRRPSGVVNALSTTVQSPPNAARAFSTPRQNPQAARTRLDDRG